MGLMWAALKELEREVENPPPLIGKVTQQNVSCEALLGLRLFPRCLSSLPDSTRRGKHEGSRVNTKAGVNPALLQDGAQESTYVRMDMERILRQSLQQRGCMPNTYYIHQDALCFCTNS